MTVKLDSFFSNEWFQNFWEGKSKFMTSDNIAAIGHKYPDQVEKLIGKHKGAYTLKDNPTYFIFGLKKSKDDCSLPEWAKGGRFTILAVTD